MMPIVDGLEEEFGGEIDIVRLDATDGDNAALQEQYGLRGHPSFVVLDESGAVVERYFGPQDEQTLRAALEEVQGAGQ
jgi:thioredoxin-like negative regulator of GroEL